MALPKDPAQTDESSSAPSLSAAPGKSGAAASSPSGDDYDNDEKVKQLVKRCVADARKNTARLERDKQDLLNLLTYRGGADRQAPWAVWDDQAGTFVPRPTSGEGGLPDYFPRLVSNIFAKKVDGIVSILNQSEPALEWKPSTIDDKDLATADVVEHAMPVLLEEIGYDTLRAQTHKLLALTDKVVQVIYFDNDEKYGMHDVPAYQCPSCQQYAEPMDLEDSDGACPACGYQHQEEGVPAPLPVATDPRSGAPIGKSYPIGKICAEKLHSFETSLPRSARTSDELKSPWLLAHSRYSKEDAFAAWPELKDLLTDEGEGGSSKLTSQTYADQARNISSPRSGQSAGGMNASNTGPVIFRLWHDAIVDDEFNFPEGLYAVVYEDDIVLDAGPLPITDDEGRPVKNVVVRTYAHSPGSPWGKPPGDDLVPLQTMQNLCLSLAFLILMHHASPRTWIPSTVTILDDLVGAPGGNVGYRSLNGEKPSTEPGQSFPEGLKWFLEYLKTSFDDLSGLNAVLQGARPEGDPTLGEIQILQERGLASFKEPLDNLIEGEKRLSRILLWTAKQTAWAPRFRQVQGENGEWEIEQFTAADLTGKVDVTCEPTSAWPRSPLLQNLRINAAIKAGILNPQDPEVQAAYLSLNDLTDFKKSIDADRKQVARQLDAWKHATSPMAITPPQPWWNLPVHLFLKTEFLKSEEFEQLQQQQGEIAQAMLAHVQQIQQLMAPPPAPVAPETPEGPTPPHPSTGAGALSHAVATGVLKPAGLPPRGHALSHAVKTGVLRPPVSAGPGGIPPAGAPPIAPPRPPGIGVPA